MLSPLNRFFKRNDPEQQPLISDNSAIKLTSFDSKKNIGLFNKLPYVLNQRCLLFLYDDEVALFAVTSLYFFQKCSHFLDRDSSKIIDKVLEERRPTEYTQIMLLESKQSLNTVQKNENTLYLTPSDTNTPSQKLTIYCWKVEPVEWCTSVLMLQPGSNLSPNKEAISLVPDEKDKMLAYWHKDNQLIIHPVTQKNTSTLKKIFGPLNRIDINHNRFQEITALCTMGSGGVLLEKTVNPKEFCAQLPPFPQPEEPPVIINRIQNKLVDQIALKYKFSKRPNWEKSRQKANIKAYIDTELRIAPAGKRLPYLVPLFFVVTGGLFLTSYFIIEPEHKNNFLKFAAPPWLLGVVSITGWGAKRLLKLKRLETLYSPSKKQNALAFYNRMEHRFDKKKSTRSEEKTTRTESNHTASGPTSTWT